MFSKGLEQQQQQRHTLPDHSFPGGGIIANTRIKVRAGNSGDDDVQEAPDRHQHKRTELQLAQ